MLHEPRGRLPSADFTEAREQSGATVRNAPLCLGADDSAQRRAEIYVVRLAHHPPEKGMAFCRKSRKNRAEEAANEHCNRIVKLNMGSFHGVESHYGTAMCFVGVADGFER